MVSVSLTPQVHDVDEFLAHCHRRRYPAKSTIIYAGDTSDALYYIISGSVTVLIEDSDGREMIVAYL
ncbi:MAG TPA: cyclic nucleotide-binding domain-containing protein, partial [Pseudomonadales bacterium]|nr:cyclic nucleotide-binding domain-containing protein [Pseudomonadales bacterium]